MAQKLLGEGALVPAEADHQVCWLWSHLGQVWCGLKPVGRGSSVGWGQLPRVLALGLLGGGYGAHQGWHGPLGESAV